MNPLILLDYCTCINTVVLIVSPEEKDEQWNSDTVNSSYADLVSVLSESHFQWKSVNDRWLMEVTSSFQHKPFLSDAKWLREFENVLLVCRFPVASVALWHSYGFLVFSTLDINDCYTVKEEDIIAHIQKWSMYPYVHSPGNLPEPLRGTDGPVTCVNGFLNRTLSLESQCVNVFQQLSVKQRSPYGI